LFHVSEAGQQAHGQKKHIMKVAIAGYSGLIGSALVRTLEEKEVRVVRITRNHLYGEASSLTDLIGGCEVVINLAGAPLIKRWTKSNRKQIYDSRILSTRALVHAVSTMEAPPALFVNASGVGIYEDKGIFTESNALLSGGFIGKLCQDWEREASAVEDHCRLVIFRLGVVLDRQGGALSRLLPFFRAGLGGRIGNGRQYFPWVHLSDVIRAFLFVMEDKRCHGVYNLSAPQVINNIQFTRALAGVLKRPALIPVPAFVLSLLFGKGSQVLTSGQGVLPQRLTEQGFSFHFPDINLAFKDLLQT